MTADRPLLLAVDLDGDGAHPAAWRDSGRSPADVLSPSAVRAAVALAETAGFALATFDDAPRPPAGEGLDAAGRIEAGTRAAYVSTLTDRIGLAPTLHVTTTEPFHLATQLASLDHASRGRAAWVVGAADAADDLATIGAPALGADDLRLQVRDVVEVARRLWDSWQDDAVIKDVATGRYLDSDRVHHVDFTGHAFTVKGPLITPRPPQGQVVVVAPSELEIDDLADVVLVAAPDLDAVRARADRARAGGVRSVFVDLEVVLDAAGESAADRLARLDAATGWRAGRRLRHVGTAAALVDLLAALAPVVDGVRLLPAVHRLDLAAVLDDVLPVLTYRAPAAGATLRESLGLPRPANRFVA